MRAIRSPELVRKIGLTIQHVGRLERAGNFPKRIQLGPGSVAWIEEEVDAWLEERSRIRGALPQPEAANKTRAERRAAARAVQPSVSGESS